MSHDHYVQMTIMCKSHVTIIIGWLQTSTDEERVWHEGFEEINLFSSLLSIQLPELKLNGLLMKQKPVLFCLQEELLEVRQSCPLLNCLTLGQEGHAHTYPGVSLDGSGLELTEAHHGCLCLSGLGHLGPLTLSPLSQLRDV